MFSQYLKQISYKTLKTNELHRHIFIYYTLRDLFTLKSIVTSDGNNLVVMSPPHAQDRLVTLYLYAQIE